MMLYTAFPRALRLLRIFGAVYTLSKLQKPLLDQILKGHIALQRQVTRKTAPCRKIAWTGLGFGREGCECKWAIKSNNRVLGYMFCSKWDFLGSAMASGRRCAV